MRIRCPWCEVWEPEEAFIELQSPPTYPAQCGIVLKHRCAPGRSMLFSIRQYDRPAEAR